MIFHSCVSLPEGIISISTLFVTYAPCSQAQESWALPKVFGDPWPKGNVPWEFSNFQWLHGFTSGEEWLKNGWSSSLYHTPSIRSTSIKILKDSYSSKYQHLSNYVRPCIWAVASDPVPRRVNSPHVCVYIDNTYYIHTYISNIHESPYAICNTQGTEVMYWRYTVDIPPGWPGYGPHLNGAMEPQETEIRDPWAHWCTII